LEDGDDVFQYFKEEENNIGDLPGTEKPEVLDYQGLDPGTGVIPYLFGNFFEGEPDDPDEEDLARDDACGYTQLGSERHDEAARLFFNTWFQSFGGLDERRDFIVSHTVFLLPFRQGLL
jgi:hypothetical protein